MHRRQLWRFSVTLFVLAFAGLTLVRAGTASFGTVLPSGVSGTKADFDRMKTAGLQQVCLHADWPRLQPAKGGWQFGWLDAQVNAAVASGLRVTLVFGPSPRWAVSYLSNPDADAVRRAKPDLPAFQAYVTAVAKRYQDRVQTYQIWERPTARTLLVMPKDVYAMYRTATKAVHGVNPSLRVIAPEPGDVQLDWIDQYLKSAQGTERADVLLLAPSRVAVTPQALWLRVQVLRNRVMASAARPALWVEIPLSAEQNTAPLALASAALVQDVCTVFFTSTGDSCVQDVPGMSAGLRALQAVQGRQHGGWLMPADGVFCAVYQESAALALLALPLQGWAMTLLPRGETSACGITATGSDVLLTALDGTAQRIPVTARTTMSLPAQPVILSGVTVSPCAQAPAFQPTPVTEESVSLDLDGTRAGAIHALPNLPGGRFVTATAAGQPVLSTVTQRAPWIYFDIPDGFLFYNTERLPVEVTVRVMGASKAGKTGFNLYYDAFGGMMNSRWQWIDVGPSEVFSYTLPLADACFADRDGYDLRLNMGGSEESVRVVDITVRKVARR